jgi:hypothetical protein
MSTVEELESEIEDLEIELEDLTYQLERRVDPQLHRGLCRIMRDLGGHDWPVRDDEPYRSVRVLLHELELDEHPEIPVR